MKVLVKYIEEISCRICLQKDIKDFDSVFADETSQNGFSEIGNLYQDLLGLEILPNDDLSPYICNYCSLQLKLFNKFKLKAIESYKLSTTENLKHECETVIDALLLHTDADIKLESDMEIQGTSEITADSEDYDENVIFNNTADQESTQIGRKENLDLTCKTNLNDNDEFEVQYLEIEEEPKYTDTNETSSNFEEKEKDEEIIDFYDEQGLECEILNDDAVVTQKLLDHDELQNEEKPKYKNLNTSPEFKCKLCESRFFKQTELIRHRKEYHKRFRFNCNICGKMFNSEESYEVHLRVHSGLPEYECSECSKTFKQKVNYQYHMKSHRNERDAKCTICDKGFLTSSDLKIHLRTHNDERRYECDVCGKRFRANTHMTNHRQTHFEKLECEICHQFYSCPNVLKTHIKTIHSNESPYSCNLCHKKFKRKHHLVAHCKVHEKFAQFRVIKM